MSDADRELLLQGQDGRWHRPSLISYLDSKMHTRCGQREQTWIASATVSASDIETMPHVCPNCRAAAQGAA